MTVGAVRIVSHSVAVEGPVAPRRSVTLFGLRVRMTVPLTSPAALTVKVYGPAPDPEIVPTDMPCAVPPISKSPAVRPVTGRVNVSV